MTQKEKELLLKDLCGRLSYGVKIHIDFKGIGHIVGDATLDSIKSVTGQVFDFVDFEQNFKNGDFLPIGGLCGNKLLHIDEFKPYLRPMSSMTEEEENEYRAINCYEGMFPCNEDALDYVLSHHFDFRGLIPMGLALEAPDGMYKFE